MMHYTYKYNSPLGEITMASNGEQLIGLWFGEQKHFASTLDANSEARDLPIFGEVSQWLDCYFAGTKPDFTPSLQLKGSSFQQSVWVILLQIPYGKLITYKEIAQQIAAQRGLAAMSSQAVGGAVGRNPISIIVPCHRVVGSTGSLTGYAGGLSKKVELLEIEQVAMEGLFCPTQGTAL